MTANAYPTATVEAFARGIMPQWAFLHDWLAWPPDTFLLTAAILSKTGCYRHVLSPDWMQGLRWQQRVEFAAHDWMRAANAVLSREADEPAHADHVLAETRDTIESLAGRITLDQLRILEDADARKLAGALITLHAIADEACKGFGLPGGTDPAVALARCLANLLVTATGSLSSIPKHFGIVLPKMRTPQAGLTLRSMSHHLTYHTTEVETMWRALPWPNIEENTLNIMAIPWPPEVKPNDFHPEPETFGSVRYFSFDPPDADDSLPVDRVVELIEHVNRQYCRVHIVVLPESSITAQEYRALLHRLRLARWRDELTHVPMVIAGVRRKDAGIGHLNEVCLAAYFAERWYDLSQSKHHRWKLDRSQIRQYQLEGRLATARNWYEKIPLMQRRLTFLAPNGWLSLCPLICEDLAQLEPVSEIIRGVGPTLLIALLADGPQLKERWSARYASVFADDPGTAVLTLTSSGMARQSMPPDRTAAAKDASRVVALWKDQVRGWQPLELPAGADAMLLTISADWTEEFTADGRTDHSNAAVFKYEGMRALRFEDAAGETRAESSESDDARNAPAYDVPWLARWGDIRELTAATFTLATALLLDTDDTVVRVVREWMLGQQKNGKAGRLPTIVRQLAIAQKTPHLAGVATDPESKGWPTPGLEWAADTMLEILTGVDPWQDDYWPRLVKDAIGRLEKADRIRRSGDNDGAKIQAALKSDPNDLHRIHRAVPIAILTQAHGHIEALRRRKSARHAIGSDRSGRPGGASLEIHEAARLLADIEDALRRYGY